MRVQKTIRRMVKAMMKTDKDEAATTLCLFVSGHGGSHNKALAIWPTKEQSTKRKGVVIIG